MVWVTIFSMKRLSSLSEVFYNVNCSFEFPLIGASVGWSWLSPLFFMGQSWATSIQSPIETEPG